MPEARGAEIDVKRESVAPAPAPAAAGLGAQTRGAETAPAARTVDGGRA